MNTWMKALSAAAICLPLSAEAAERLSMDMIVDRDKNDISYFIVMPAENVAEVSGGDTSLIFAADGFVPIEAFRQTGSFDTADQVFGRLTATAEDGAADFASMSMMLHPKDQAMPFETPFDALTAISVCSVEYQFRDFTPADLVVYYGAFADEIGADETVELSFPTTGRAPIDLTIRHYINGEYAGTEEQVLADGAPVILTPQSVATMPVQPVAMALGLALLIVGAWRYRSHSSEA